MATNISTNINDEDEVVLNRLVAEWNIDPVNAGDQLTPAQFFRQHARDWLRMNAARYAAEDQIGMRAAYRLATLEEQATIDTILDPYRDGGDAEVAESERREREEGAGDGGGRDE
jgi:hypothetical protein